MSTPLLIRDVRLGPDGDGSLRDVRLRSGQIAEVGARLEAHGEQIVSGRGGALLPGLHDHHLHLLAWAAARESVPCGPPGVRDAAGLAARLAAAQPRDGWIRGVGYHESVAGELDASRLDALRADVPVRVQHRSGALWAVNGAGAQRLRLAEAELPGIERDADGRPTGRLWRLDRWLAARIQAPGPDLAPIWAELAGSGVVGATDATPDLDSATAGLLRGSAPANRRLLLLGARDEPMNIPVKIVITDHALPELDELVETVRGARPRPVAVHCVSRVAILLCLATLSAAGNVHGDRIEHAAVVPPDVLPTLFRLGLTVVTQPSFVSARGDDYLRDVESDDRECLWPYASLLAAGIGVAASSDAPYGSPDPWRSMAAAIDRRTAAGQVLGPAERIPAETALRGWLAPPHDLGGPSRRIVPGSPADVVLLDRPLAEVLADPARERVRLTVAAGSVVYCREDG